MVQCELKVSVRSVLSVSAIYYAGISTLVSNFAKSECTLCGLSPDYTVFIGITFKEVSVNRKSI